MKCITRREVKILTTILNGMTDVTTALVGVVTSVVTLVVAQPLLLIPVLMGFVGGGIGLFSKLRHG